MSTACRIVLVQGGIGVLSSVFFNFVSGSAGTSAILALCCVLVPTMYYAWIQGRSLNAARILMHGILKTVLTVVLIAVCIVVVGIEPLGFFVTLAVMQLGYLASGQPRSAERS